MPVIRSLCGQCSLGCGVRAVVGEAREVSIAGDPAHPVNSGRLCPKSTALTEQLKLDDRLLQPMINGRPVGWPRAISHAARRLSHIIACHGGESVALHVAGDLLTEDYYVANKLMKGFVGSAHIDAPGIETDGVAAAQRAAFGEDVMPAAMEDVEQADLLLVVGAATLHRHPILHERIKAARAGQGSRLVLIARGEEGGDIDADLRVAIAPGSEAAFFSGLLLHAHDSGSLDESLIASSLIIPPDFWAGLKRGHDLWSVARLCGLDAGPLRSLYEMVLGSGRLVTLFSPDSDASGDVGVRLAGTILNLHLATGQVGKPGAAPFAIAGAPNSMGAREVGCGAAELSAHRDFCGTGAAHVARFWGAPALVSGAGLSGEALTEAVAGGRIKAMLMLGGLSSAADRLRGLLDRIPLAILSTPWIEPELKTGRLIALPSPPWIEKDGTLTSTDRLISRQRHLLPLAGEARPDWWIVTQIARAMGWGDAFHYERPAEIYREHARLTAYYNEDRRLLNLRRHAPISNPAYAELTPWRWGEVPFDEGRFPTSNRKARLVAYWDS
ncbi:molybdopterin oxidoreductase family protein [Sphingobium bisphenolivorans]|uniref:molybdopterin oxidoreductase family protein n=1 Tax=Sphingobium bisphenolivorans TaxID=1335760 RepID=UPI0003B4FF3D|nr:molybdopterin-dependent oxidoreductase [Sphingobium bisphenolivorans]